MAFTASIDNYVALSKKYDDLLAKHEKLEEEHFDLNLRMVTTSTYAFKLCQDVLGPIERLLARAEEESCDEVVAAIFKEILTPLNDAAKKASFYMAAGTRAADGEDYEEVKEELRKTWGANYE